MAAGDYVVRRNNANTDTVPVPGSDLLTLWDTAVANKGSGIGYSSGIYALGEVGKFLVIASDQYGTVSTTNERVSAKMTLTLAGVELEEGYTTSYVRKNGGSQEAIGCSCAIINVASITGTGDELEIRLERIDDSITDTISRIPDRSGVTIMKLDDDWDVGRYVSASPTATSTTDNVAVTMNIQTTVEEDVTFTRASDSVDIATDDLVLAIYSLKSEDATPTTNRQEFQARLTLNGTPVPGSYSQTYIRYSDNCIWGGMCGACLLTPTSGDDLELEIVTRDLGGCTFTAALQLVKLPATAKAAIMEATSGDFNTAATNFTWDTLPYIDTDAFSAVEGDPNIDVDADGDYLVLASLAATSQQAVARAVPALSFKVDAVDIEHAGCSSYNRNSGTTGWASIGTGALLPGLSAGDSLYVHNDRLGTATAAINNGSGAFAVIDLASLFPTGAVALAGSINAVSSISGTLSSIVPLAGTIAAQSNISGSLSSTVPLAGTIAAQSGLAGSLVADRALTGVIAAQSSITGSLVADRALAGTIAAQSSITGSLVADRALAGAIAAQSSITGTLIADRALAGTIAAISNIEGSLSATVPLSGVIAAISNISGSISLMVPLAGSINAQSGLTGSLIADRALTGVIASQSGLTGSLAADRALAGIIAGISGLAGTLIADRALAGVIAAQSSLTGSLIADRALAGVIAAQSGLSGSLTATVSLTGTIAAQSGLSGSLSAAVPLAGSINAVSSISGTLSATVPLAGTIAAQSGLSGALVADRALAGVIAALSALTGELTVTKPAGVALAGTIAAVSTITGTLSVELGRMGTGGRVRFVDGSTGKIYLIEGATGEIQLLTGDGARGSIIIGGIHGL